MVDSPWREGGARAWSVPFSLGKFMFRKMGHILAIYTPAHHSEKLLLYLNR
jgi:hypothetical protein